MTPPGLLVLRSPHAPATTVDRLAAAIASHGMTIMARIDHAAAAQDAGLALRPTMLLIFGNPRAGTLLMQQAQTIGIDLPLKALVWQDDQNRTWIGYNDPHWLAARHAVAADAIVETMRHTLATIAQETVTADSAIA
jgi:uncharacterized protein (DUF302 family)